MKTRMLVLAVLSLAVLEGCARRAVKQVPLPSDTRGIQPGPAATWRVQCRLGEVVLPQLLKSYALQFQDLEVEYGRPWPRPTDPVAEKRAGDALTDCSGMFHRVVWKFNQACPGYDLPSHKAQRKTSQASRWYAKRGLLTVIRNARQQAHLIRPGMVMFYGAAGRRYAGKELDSVSQIITRVRHMGIVTDTTSDAEGLNGYFLFHGRSPKKSARITYHRAHPPSHPLFPYGNGSQQWIGIAPFLKAVPAGREEARNP